MKRISSSFTFFHKRVLPYLFFGGILLFMVMGLSAPVNHPVDRLPFVIFPIVSGAVMFVVLSRLVFGLVDTVYDLGDALLVKNKGMEVRIPLANIINVNSTQFTNPPRITLRLREPCELGKEISFIFPSSSNPFKRSTLATELIDRIDAIRQLR